MNQGITSEIKREIEENWAKIMAESSHNLPETSGKIIEYLRDRESQQTSDYIIRKSIQNGYPEYVRMAEKETGIICTDLNRNKNLPWDEKNINKIADNLFKNIHWDAEQMKRISEKTNEKIPSRITKNQWIGYLKEHRKIQRKQLFHIALSLRMDIDTTQKLLMACGAEPYNLHDVFDVICRYCQMHCSEKNYSHAWQLYVSYTEKVRAIMHAEKESVIPVEGNRAFSSAAHGFTLTIYEAIKDSADDESFINELVEHREYFTGYSINEWSRYHQFARFLAVLYPEYDYQYVYYESRKPGNKIKPVVEEITKKVPFHEMELLIEKEDTRESSIQKKSVPDMNKLITAMFSQAIWFSGNNGSKDKLKNVAKVQKDIPGLIQTFCDTYKERCQKIYRQKIPVEREDVLLFSFFFISCYMYQSASGKECIKRDLKKLTTDETRLEKALWDVIKELDSDQNIQEARYDTIIRCLNCFLNSFDFVEVYLPSSFDRFIVLSLLCDAPMSISSEILDSIRLEREEGLLEN